MDNTGLDELLHRARRHDPEALAKLVEAYSPRVFGLLYRLTGVRDVAEDLMQETFLRVIRMIGHYRHVGKFEPWLFRIAGNLARDRARRLGRRGEVASLERGWTGDDSAQPGRPASPTDGPHERLVQQERGRRLEMAMERLSQAEREIVLLRHFSELPFRQIADMLNIPIGTALARAHRALQHLRDELAEED